MKKLLFCTLVSAAFLSGNALAEGCLYSNHSKMVDNDQVDDAATEEQLDPILLALLMKQKKQDEQVIETVVTYN